MDHWDAWGFMCGIISHGDGVFGKKIIFFCLWVCIDMSFEEFEAEMEKRCQKEEVLLQGKI